MGPLLVVVAVGLASGCASHHASVPSAPARVEWTFAETEPVFDPELARRTMNLGMNMAMLDPEVTVEMVTTPDARVVTEGVVEVRVGPSALARDGAEDVLTLPVRATLVDRQGRIIRRADVVCTSTGTFAPDPQFAVTGVANPEMPPALHGDYGAMITLGRACGEQVVRELDEARRG